MTDNYPSSGAPNSPTPPSNAPSSMLQPLFSLPPDNLLQVSLPLASHTQLPTTTPARFPSQLVSFKRRLLEETCLRASSRHCLT